MKRISRLFSNLTKYKDKSLTRAALGAFNENRREGESDIIRREYYTDPEFNPKFMLGLAFGNKYCKATQSLAITAQHARAFYNIPFLPLIAQYAILSNIPLVLQNDWETDTRTNGRIVDDVPMNSRQMLEVARGIIDEENLDPTKALYIAHPAHLERVVWLAENIGFRGKPFVEVNPVWNTGQEKYDAGATISQKEWKKKEKLVRLHHILKGWV